MSSVHAAEDGDGKNPGIPPKNAQGTPDDSDDSERVLQPGPTANPPQRQKKAARSVFGLQQREFKVGGNDPSDYEQKFPEDKRHEELGPLARVWRTYLEECDAFDKEMLDEWRDGLDVFLVFAGLFSAVVTTFVAQTSQSLQVDYGQVTATLVYELIDVQRAAANGSSMNDVPRSDLTPFSTFSPATSDVLVNGLWFTSLSFSLTTALFAVLTKQWIHQYVTVPSGTPRDKCRVRQFRYMGLQQWSVGLIIGLLPVLLSASVGVFFLGLVIFLVPLKVSIAYVVGIIASVSFAAYFITNFLPIWYASCPYKTPLSHYVFLLYAYLAHLISSVCCGSPSSKPQAIHSLRDVELVAVESCVDDIDVHALAWLFGMSSNPSVQSIVVQSTSALPLRSVESLKQHAKGISDICNTLIERMLDRPQESVLDRLLRTSLRFDVGAVYRWSVERRKQFLSGSAELLWSPFGNSSPKEVVQLVKAQLTFPRDEDLDLQPIVWAYLLQRLPPFDVHDGLLQMFFHAIPSSYWHANYVLPPLFLTRDGLKICLTDHSRDHDVVNLLTAVETYLYPYVADVILRRFRGVKDSVFHSDPTDEFPPPQDPRLCILLTIAGSPSMQTVTIADPYIDTFETVIRNIGVYMGVGSSRLYDDPGYDKMPSFRLDCNRYAVLKLLYTLVSSEDFSGSTSMRSEDQSILLVIFLRVLKSTFPRPQFLPDSEDWCTPYMASNFVRIAFQDNPWITAYEPTYLSHFKLTAELATFFFQFPPIMEEVFSHVVSRRLLDQILHDTNLVDPAFFPHPAFFPDLPIILDAFITGLASNSGISQMSTDYLFESDILFRACTVLVSWDKADSLRRLTLLRAANDPAWPECLQKLDTISEHFQWPNFMEHACTIAGFREFIEGGCVGDFGLGGCPPGRAPDKEKHPMGLRVMMKSPQKHWHRLRRPRSSGVAAEGTMHNGSKCE